MCRFSFAQLAVDGPIQHGLELVHASVVGVAIGPLSTNDRAEAERLLASWTRVEAISVEVRGGWAEPGDLVTMGLGADEDYWGECAVIVHQGKVRSLTLPTR